MQKLFSILAVVAVLGPVSAFAAVQLPAGCTQDDLKVWNWDNSQIASCVPAVQVAADRARQAARNIDSNRIAFATGTSLVLRGGGVATCPWWFPYAGCVIARELVK